MARRSTTLPSRQEEDLAVLDDLAETIDENAREERQLARRIRQLRAGRAAGRPWHALVDQESTRGLLELSGRILRRAADVSGHLRRRLAAGLRSEGASLPAIARWFGVTHQRISTLLRNGDAPG